MDIINKQHNLYNNMNPKVIAKKQNLTSNQALFTVNLDY